MLQEVLDAKRKGKTYSIVFVGINGVGKSTSLSKVAYYLKEHNIDVMITACDTFRSGAVEQLRSHAKCLDVELFEKGYLKDPADVARASRTHAKQAKKDCVLIDTAGRMQNNDKLMRELAKLVSVNTPDLVLFVGEALVGNDGIDQLNMFNKSLAVLTKFCYEWQGAEGQMASASASYNQVRYHSDKVGATLSMTYKTGQPTFEDVRSRVRPEVHAPQGRGRTSRLQAVRRTLAVSRGSRAAQQADSGCNYLAPRARVTRKAWNYVPTLRRAGAAIQTEGNALTSAPAAA